jgi:hypothetical protein
MYAYEYHDQYQCSRHFYIFQPAYIKAHHDKQGRNERRREIFPLPSPVSYVPVNLMTIMSVWHAA